MKVNYIVFLGLLAIAFSIKCKEDEVASPKGIDDCKIREHGNDKYCCYIKGKMRKGFYIYNVDGCIEMDKIDIDNDAIEKYMEQQENYGSKFSLDCSTSYLSLGLLSLLMLFF